MNKQDAALDKIKRLLRLGQRSANQGESQNALAMAAKIAARHSIDLAAVKTEEDKERIAHETFPSRAFYNKVESSAFKVVMSLFHCSAVYERDRATATATLIGAPHNLAAARCALGFIIEQAGRDLKEFRRQHRLLSRRRLAKGAESAFLDGWGAAVIHKFKAVEASTPELNCAQYAIVLAADQSAREDYVRRLHPDIKERRQRESNNDYAGAWQSGVRAGRDVEVRNTIESAPVQTLALES